MKMIAENKKAYFDYFIEDKFESGMVLFGGEIKSIRAGNINLKDSFVIIKNGEAFLVGAHISPYKNTTSEWGNFEPRRTRKLLLNKVELSKLEKKSLVKGYTLVPLSVYLKGGYAKLLIAVAKGKQLHNKRDFLKEKDLKRETDRELKDM